MECFLFYLIAFMHFTLHEIILFFLGHPVRNKNSFERSFPTFWTVLRSLTYHWHCTDSTQNKQKTKKNLRRRTRVNHVRSCTAHAKSTPDFALQNSIYFPPFWILTSKHRSFISSYPFSLYQSLLVKPNFHLVVLPC